MRLGFYSKDSPQPLKFSPNFYEEILCNVFLVLFFHFNFDAYEQVLKFFDVLLCQVILNAEYRYLYQTICELQRR